MTDTPQPQSVAAAILQTAVSNSESTIVPTTTSAPMFISAVSAVVSPVAIPSYKALAESELSKIKASLVTLEMHISNIKGDVSDEVIGAVKKLEMGVKTARIQGYIITFVGIVIAMKILGKILV